MADRSTTRQRIAAATGAALLQALLGYVLIAGLAVHLPTVVRDDLKLFGIVPPPPPPPREKIVREPMNSHKPQGAASPPNLRAKATEIVAPHPVLPAIVPPPIVTATIAGVGSDASAGAADVRGPGTGSGGAGVGTGSGGAGDGEGDGDGTPPRFRKGRLAYSDLARAGLPEGTEGTLGVRYTVEADGRATHCAVTQSSGNAALDTVTCRLIEQRFRYAPARDDDGEAVPSIIVENQSWYHREAPADDPAR